MRTRNGTIGAVTAAVAILALVIPLGAGVAGAATETLVARGSVWKYLDNGTDQGTAWRAPGFADAAWKSGPAELGYGDGHELTVVSYGPDASHKYKTTYFRRTFSVTNPGAVTSLALGIRRDDGAAVYLNGAEVARSNLPTGALTYLTDATTWDVSETVYNAFTVPTSALVAGTNTIAVEIHQNGWASSDISMDLDLAATTTTSTTTTTSSTTTSSTTTSTTTSTTSTTTSTTSSTVPSGPQTLVARGSVWKYLDNGTDQGTAWRAPGFADAAWKSGPAELGYGDGHELTVVSYGPDASHKYKTTYFRRTFSVTNPGAITSLALAIRRDDGAAVYLNGTEVARSNLPTGALTYLTDATTWDVSETVYNAFTVPTSALVAGTNTIAVEIHQNGWASSDISMDLELLANTGGTTTTTSTTTTTTTTTPPGDWSCAAGYVALTFDDGPDITASRDNTSKILDTLEEYGVHATFFVLGEHVADPGQPGRPDLVAREAAEGHAVGNHSYQHYHLPDLSSSEITWQLSHNVDVIEAAGGGTPTLFRPPYGDTNSTVFDISEGLGSREVMWDLSPGDTGATSASWVVDRVVPYVQSGSIVTLHDGSGPYTAAAVPMILDGLRSRGFCPGLIEPTTTYNAQVDSYVEVVADPAGPHR